MPRVHRMTGLRLPRRQGMLFLIAILVPCVVLLSLGLLALEYERQLDAKRLSDARQRLVDQVRRQLISELEKIKLEEVTKVSAPGGAATAARPDNAVALVAPILDGTLQLPWENNPAADEFLEGLSEGSFAQGIREAEAQELVAHQYESAARRYRDLIGAAKGPAQQGYGRLLLARTLQKSGRRAESESEYGRVLSLPRDVVDEHGVPLGLYAAPPLLEAAGKHADLVSWTRLSESGGSLWPPAALRMAQAIAAKLAVSEAMPRLDQLIREREQAEAFQRDFARAFSGGAADETLIATVFRSTLPEGERLSVEQLVDEICRGGRRARHVGGADHIIYTIIAERRPGDVVVIMSNGGFDNIHRRLLARLRESGKPQTEGAA